MGEWMDDGWMDVRLNGWVDRWEDELMGRWMNEYESM